MARRKKSTLLLRFFGRTAVLILSGHLRSTESIYSQTSQDCPIQTHGGA